ncbi:MAG: DUF2156 domain-containing protein [Parachlamydiaceae bacterium]|nr:DUF2156 domain-containing protein [Parachlamydiaceae bacterium]
MLEEMQPTQTAWQSRVELVRKWGDVNTNGLLEVSTLGFSIPEIEGFIGYRIEAANAVVLGEPACALENKGALAFAFQDYCALKNLGVVYTIVSQDFAKWAQNNLEAATIEFGEKYIFDPHSNPMNNQGHKASLVRRKFKHAIKEGAVVKEYLEYDILIEQEIENASEEWLKSRHGPQIYLCHMTLFKNRYGKRWFYAERSGKIVGLLILNNIETKKGWLITNVMMFKDAPHGLSELLIISVLQLLEKENCRYVLAGPIPTKQLGKINGITYFKAKLTGWIFKFAKFIFHLEGHEVFWDKFQPQSESSYLVFPKKNLTYSSIKALMRAYNVSVN